MEKAEKPSEKKFRIEDLVDPDFQPVFPNRVSFGNLICIPALPPVKIHSLDLIREKDFFRFSLTFELFNETRVNFYLFVNKKKYDLFYMIKKGTYRISDMVIDETPSEISCFYVSGLKRSEEQFIYTASKVKQNGK